MSQVVATCFAYGKSGIHLNIHRANSSAPDTAYDARPAVRHANGQISDYRPPSDIVDLLAFPNRGGMDMSKLMILLIMTAGLGLAGCAAQRPAPVAAKPVAPISKDAYDTAIRNAEAQYKVDRDACSPRSGNSKDICLAEASGKEKVAKADAEAAYKNTPKAREDARVTRADATHDVAKEKCDDLSGNAKDVCTKEVDAALVKAKADAKIDRVAADTREDSAMKQADVRRQAAEDKRDADYKVAAEKCDGLSGPAKNACISDAKLRYGK